MATKGWMFEETGDELVILNLANVLLFEGTLALTSRTTPDVIGLVSVGAVGATGRVVRRPRGLRRLFLLLVGCHDSEEQVDSLRSGETTDL